MTKRSDPAAWKAIERLPFLHKAQADPRGTLVALDVDGTVSPIVESPQDATVGAEVRATLDHLSRRLHLWFVSGRNAEDARRMVDVAAAGYVGSHGLEVLDDEGLRPLQPMSEFQDTMARFAQAVAADVPEAAPHVERKRWGVAFHYRAIQPPSDIALKLQRSIEAHLTPNLRVQSGKMVFEVVPAVEYDKGTALLYLIDTIRPQRVLTAGDDLTDVAMFGALAERREQSELEGLSIAVLHGPETPAEVVRAVDATVEGVDGLHHLLRALQ